ncbi:MAG: 2-amino-4-hydroxy-6-hydroxymethyldihydropteridine diphosphokinase [Candidatus Cloacimonetes bacterium]|nr:2-amino-4-hydroxy-6-hydroxymethyldihydropteridine diphosphokinase [Candidatus Cloacimonadota bacterium]
MGSNLGNRKQFIDSAISALRDEKRISVKHISTIIETAPIGKSDQPDFLNCIVQCDTDMNPEELMNTLLSIEQKLGRVRREKWGPRTIDLDILFFDKKVIDTHELRIPHPEFMNRQFLKHLMNELKPQFIHPELKKSMKELNDNDKE